MRLTATLALLVVASLALAGCAADEPTPIAAPPTVTPTPTPTPTPEPVQPALNDLALTPEGLGGVLIGEAPPAVDPELAVIIFDEDYCQSDFDAGYIESPGKWIPNYEPALTTQGREPFSVAVRDGVVKEFSIDDEQIQTAEGVGLGSTLDEVLTAYPDIEFVKGGNTNLYVLTGEHGRLVFEIGAPEVEVDYEPNIVEFVRVSNLKDPLFGWANTDAGYAYCQSA